MEKEFAEISWKGRFVRVPAIPIGGLTVIVQGKWIRKAGVKDENWLPGDVVGDPEAIMAELKREKSGVDIFRFAQKTPGATRAFPYPVEQHNIAAIPIVSFADWWEGLSQGTRRNVRLAERNGVTVRRVALDDELIKGIMAINNEAPVRQGRRYWHYGKGVEEVRRDYSDLLDRSEFFGAYYENRLIGFLRLIDMGDMAGIMQLMCLHAYCDKRPANALIAKAVEFCADTGKKYLTHHQYTYGNKGESSLTEFKRRNGFEQFFVPSYCIPLTLRGRIAVSMNMHKGFKSFIPRPALNLAKKLRAGFYRRTKAETVNGGMA